VLFDTRASTCFVDGSWLEKARKNNFALNVQSLCGTMSIRVANNEQLLCAGGVCWYTNAAKARRTENSVQY